MSSVTAEQIPAIRRLLEQDLKARGVVSSGADSATLIRVTLSENSRGRLWIAEIVEGKQTRVVMIRVDTMAVHVPPAQIGLMLRKQRIWSPDEVVPSDSAPLNDPVLAVTETSTSLIVLRQDAIVVYSISAAGWHEQQRVDIVHRAGSTRDPRGVVLRSNDGNGFTAFTADTRCGGTYAQATDNSGWTIHCHASDDPWPLIASNESGNTMKAFYNASRDYFTGVIVPSLGVDLPPFYSAAVLPRANENIAMLINGVDGKSQVAENNTIQPVTGTRDWGSDFAALRSGCGANTQIIASNSGEALTDSLRAYEIPAQDAIPVSAPMLMEGTVTALAPAADGKSVLAIVRQSTGNYEVDRVTALCN